MNNKPDAPTNAFTLAVAAALEPEDVGAYLSKKSWVPAGDAGNARVYRSPDGVLNLTFPARRGLIDYARATQHAVAMIAMDEGRDVSYDLAFFQFAAEIAGARGRVGHVYRVLTDFLHGSVGVKGGTGAGSERPLAAIA